MASFIRGKQSGIQGDLSSGITPDIIQIDDVRPPLRNSNGRLTRWLPVRSVWHQLPDISSRI
jgi:hypothetical protein